MDFINLISVNVVVNDYNNYLDEKNYCFHLIFNAYSTYIPSYF